MRAAAQLQSHRSGHLEGQPLRPFDDLDPRPVERLLEAEDRRDLEESLDLMPAMARPEKSSGSLWTDAGPEGRRALATALFAKLEVEGYQRMEYALTPFVAEYLVMPFRSPTITSAPVAGLVQPPLPPEPPAEMSRSPEPEEFPFQEPT